MWGGNIDYANSEQKKVVVYIRQSRFQANNITRNKQGYS